MLKLGQTKSKKKLKKSKKITDLTSLYKNENHAKGVVFYFKMISIQLKQPMNFGIDFIDDHA